MNTKLASLEALPTEILLQINQKLSNPREKVHLIRCCRRFEAQFLDLLYLYDVHSWNSSALLWACQTGNIAAAQRSLQAGTSVNYAFFGEHDRQRRRLYVWPPSQAKAMREKSTPMPGRPLSVAVRARQKEMVVFLLAQGADPNMPDTRRAAYHIQVWFPIHWAVSCGSWGGGAFFKRPPCDPVLVDANIVDLLLQHGADANQPTAVDPITGPVYATHSHASNEAKYALYMSLCEHVPASVVHLLLEAGAKSNMGEKEFGCNGRWSRGLWTPLYILGPHRPHESEIRDEKMALLARRSSIAYSLKFDGDTVPQMMAQLTPARMQLLELMAMIEAEPKVRRSGVSALLLVWIRQTRAVLDVKGQECEDDEAALLSSLEETIAKLFTIYANSFANEDMRAQVLEIVPAFLWLCQNSPAPGRPKDSLDSWLPNAETPPECLRKGLSAHKQAKDKVAVSELEALAEIITSLCPPENTA